MNLIECKRTCTSPYNPKSNGLIEHRCFKASLVCHKDRTNWVYLLPTVLLGLRNNFKEDIGEWFIDSSDSNDGNESECLAQLQELRPRPIVNRSGRAHFVHH